MDKVEKQQVTDIVNAFRLINKDIRECFKIMSEELKSKNNFENQWKNNNGGNKSYTSLFDGDDWYYLNFYGLYNQKIVGFTFLISISDEEKDNVNYADFLDKLDKNINKNTPMICISGVYEPIAVNNIKLTGDSVDHYVDDILQFTDDWKNYEIEKIKYDEWIDVEVNYLEDNKVREGYEGWYKRAKVKINNLTDISSKEEALKIINDLIKCKI